MITAPLIALAAAASGALATPYKRADALTVEITSPGESIKSIDGLKFTASVTNTGSEDVKVLKYGTVLDNLPTRSFSVTKDGSAVAFEGVKLNVNLSDDAYTTIKGGETVKVEHDLTKLYDFAAAGTGKFDFAPNTAFKLSEASTSSKVATIQSTAKPITVEITGDVAKRNFPTPKRSAHSKRLDKRSVVECSDSTQSSFIEGSYTESKELASLGAEYVGSGGELVEAYFSSNDPSAVSDILDGVATEDDSSRTLSCTDEYDVCDGNVIAYTLIATTNIYYCDIFFDEVETSELCGSVTVNDRAIRGGTTLHEMTHAIAETDDVTYGCDADQALSASEQISNADNFNCFTTQVYADSQC